MSRRSSRRLFLQTTGTAGAAIGLGDWTGLVPLSPATADEAKVPPDLVRFSPDIEPTVRLIAETPREKCVEVMVEQLRRGLPYRNFLAALYLVAIRAARWHGGIHGYDHNAYVVHSVHQLTLDLPVGERLLPLFYALDNFKGMQSIYPNRPGTPPLRGALPAAEKAASELHAGLKEWEPERAERAVVALARSRGMAEVFEPLWHYAGRDWGFIGHMAILVSNSCRLLETIGWQHAEHVLRYIVAGLAGWGKEHAEHADVRPYWANLKRIDKLAGPLPGDWAGSGPNEGLTKELVAFLREGKADEACDLALRQLATGKAQASAVWDAVHLAAGELALRCRLTGPQQRTHGDALHANTAVNALHYAFRAATQPDTRLLLTLQGLAWAGLYRDLVTRKKLLARVIDITALKEEAKPPESTDEAVRAILASRTIKPHEASRLAFALAQRHRVGPLLQEARRLLPSKSSGDPHDLKFPVAICEDLDLVSPGWRPHLLAAATFSFCGSDRPDLPAIERAREALRNL
jgi:hypothetical protein